MRISDWSSDVCSSDLPRHRECAFYRNGRAFPYLALVSRTIDMTNFPEDHPSPSRTGLLLVNLGTPDAPEPAAVKRYLKQFLSDPRVVEIPSVVWQPILRGVILNVRPKKSAHRSDEHTSELQSLMRISYAVFCLQKK